MPGYRIMSKTKRDDIWNDLVSATEYIDEYDFTDGTAARIELLESAEQCAARALKTLRQYIGEQRDETQGKRLDVVARFAGGA